MERASGPPAVAETLPWHRNAQQLHDKFCAPRYTSGESSLGEQRKFSSLRPRRDDGLGRGPDPVVRRGTDCLWNSS